MKMGDYCGDSETNESFYATCCQTCKLFPPAVDLKRCGRCRMISYCSLEHQKENWPKHKDLCNSIASVCKNNGKSTFFESSDLNMTLGEWCSLRMKYMAAAEVTLARKLFKHEREMFFFPRVCRTCKTFNNGKLINCERCFCVSYCSAAHQKADEVSHSALCCELKLCKEMDTSVDEILDVDGFAIKIQEKHIQLPKDTREFINQQVIFPQKNGLTPVVLCAFVSEVITCPLTLLYAIENERIMKEDLVVHIVGASCLECTFLCSWETILHWLPGVKQLYLVFIGPEVVEGETCILCSDCRNKGRIIKIELYRHPYRSFAKSDNYSLPSIIMAYNSGINEHGGGDDTWRQSISFFLKFDAVPFVLTSYTVSEAESDLDKVSRNANCEIDVSVSCERNPFSSLRPYRDWETDPLKAFWANGYLSIIKRKNTRSVEYTDGGARVL